MFGAVKELSKYKTSSERAIAKRKVYLESQNWLQGKIKNETHLLHNAKWQNQGVGVAKKKFLNQRLQQMRAEARQNLNVRKSKLAMLLKGEEDKYINEL